MIVKSDALANLDCINFEMIRSRLNNICIIFDIF